jgi:hypothetical protein
MMMERGYDTEMTPSLLTHKVKASVASGLQKGWSGYVWMLKIIVPLSFLTFLMDAVGLIRQMDFILAPMMGLLGLPPSAAIPLLLGLLTGVYGTLAAMAAISFSVSQMTLIAVFTLIAHNLIQEGLVQSKSGLNVFATSAARLLAAILMTLLTAWLLGIRGEEPGGVALASAAADPFGLLLKKWAVDMAWLCLKIFIIIMALMVALKILKDFHLAEKIVAVLTPLLKLLGLSRPVGLIWLTAGLFGLSYGAAVIVEEAREGNFSPDELTRLQLSIGINHSMLDDPLLFMAFGINPFWLWVPRLAAAIIVVRVFMFLSRRK